jgi:hypothetical protein
MKGFSGAEITFASDHVMKRSPGSTKAAEEGAYAALLGKKICPDVIHVGKDVYSMETLTVFDQYDQHRPDVFRNMHYALELHVWNRQIVTPDRSWMGNLIEWLGPFGFPDRTVRMLNCMYPDPERMAQCFIHGDPTVCNLMWRVPGTEFVIGDPIPPAGKIPGRPEVDIGKMVQSAVGWEEQCYGWEPVDHTLVFDTLLGHYSAGMRERIWFWCAIHLLRTVPYSKANKRHDLAQWARQQAELILNVIRL